MNLKYKEFIVIIDTLKLGKKYSDKGFVNRDNGAQGGTHWIFSL